MSYAWKRVAPKDATTLELRRLRLIAEKQLLEGRRRRKVTLAEIDAFLWRNWYRLRDDVCERLGAIVEGRATRASRRRARIRSNAH
jgi:hypothetical protein